MILPQIQILKEVFSLHNLLIIFTEQSKHSCLLEEQQNFKSNFRFKNYDKEVYQQGIVMNKKASTTYTTQEYKNISTRNCYEQLEGFHNIYNTRI